MKRAASAANRPVWNPVPMKAIKFVAATPNQKETEGYDVNLRNDHWLNLGLVETTQSPGICRVDAETRGSASQNRNQRKG